jgi:hypothetical protein
VLSTHDVSHSVGTIFDVGVAPLPNSTPPGSGWIFKLIPFFCAKLLLGAGLINGSKGLIYAPGLQTGFMEARLVKLKPFYISVYSTYVL